MTDDKEHDYFEGRELKQFGDPENADYEHEAERGQARAATRFLAGLLGVFLAIAAAVALAAPPPPVTRGHPADCNYFSDMAITARALAKEGVKREVAMQVFAHVYDLNAPFRPEIAAEIIKAAYRSSDEPQLFAGKLRFLCARQNGEMQQLLVPSTM